MKDLFTGALGRLNNHGGSRIYTTPNTILVPPEYEIEIGEHGNFISCTLDGRLWLFEDRIIALKWNKEAGKMEYAASKSFSDENFVARGRDWILTDSSVIQVTDESPYIFYETHNEDITPMENFYSLLPALDGFQIIKGYLIRKPNESYENLMYPISMPDIYLTFNGNTIWARTPSGIGKVLITENDGAYSLDFSYSYTFSDNSWQNMGIAFIGEKIYGFKNKENNKGLCPCSENNQLYSLKNSSWLDLSGNIFFDPFNRSGVVINNNGINLLANEKSIECKGLSQWIAPAKQIQSINDNAIISSINNSVLATYFNLGLYRGLLPQKALALTTQAYENNKLSLGLEDNFKININTLISNNRVLITIRVANPPNKQWFERDEILDYTGIIIVAEYSDGTIRDVTQECIFTPNNGTVATENIADITASYTENGVTQIIKLDELKLDIEFLNIFDDEVCYVKNFNYYFDDDYSYYLPHYIKRIYNKHDYTHWNWTSDIGPHEIRLTEREAYIISPITGELIDISYSFEGIHIWDTQYDYDVYGYFCDPDGTIGIHIDEDGYVKQGDKYIWISNKAKRAITHISTDALRFSTSFMSIYEINEEPQKVYFRHQQLNLSSSITIQDLKELREKYPFSQSTDFIPINTKTQTKQEVFFVYYLSKKELDFDTNVIYNDNYPIITDRSVSIPTKIMTFKVKVIPNVLAINKPI